jgi:hypothetical protein
MIMDRQCDGKDGSFTWQAFHQNFSTMFLDDAVADTETQTGSLANLFGREKWFEDSVSYFFRHAATGIPDAQYHRVIDLTRGDGDGAVAADGVGGIYQQIDDDLTQLIAGTADLRNVAQLQVEFGNILYFVTHNVNGAPDTIIQIRQLETAGIGSGKTLQIMDYLFDSRGTFG